MAASSLSSLVHTLTLINFLPSFPNIPPGVRNTSALSNILISNYHGSLAINDLLQIVEATMEIVIREGTLKLIPNHS